MVLWPWESCIKKANADGAETIKKVTRLATVDMRVDYLAPGRGQSFTLSRAETLRLGRKGCTMRMTLVNDENKAIATAICILYLLSLLQD